MYLYPPPKQTKVEYSINLSYPRAFLEQNKRASRRRTPHLADKVSVSHEEGRGTEVTTILSANSIEMITQSATNRFLKLIYTVVLVFCRNNG